MNLTELLLPTPESTFPLVAPLFCSGDNNILYTSIIQNSLRKIIPPSLLNLDQCTREGLREKKTILHSSLPLLNSCFAKPTTPTEVSFFALSHYRPNVFKFFFNMISSWLVPGKRLPVLMLYAVDFQLPQLCNEIYTLCEIMLSLQDGHELAAVHHNLPIIEAELRLGMSSAYYGNKILEIKGLSADQKTAILHEHAVDLIRRRPRDFDSDLLVEMQHLLVICSDKFKAARTTRHLNRIISIHYLFRKALLTALNEAPKRRLFHLKLFKARIGEQGGKKPVLGIILGVNFLKDKEVFNQRHVLCAIQHFIPNTEAVEGSFFANRHRHELIATIYLEVCKTDGEEFTFEEMRLLRRELPNDLQDHIEQPMQPIFTLRNEEEILRNIVQLSNEFTSPRHLPQVFISFDEQTPSDLLFTLIVLRAKHSSSTLSIEQLFSTHNSPLEYIPDRCREVGSLGNNSMKEATVFRVKLPKEPFLRRDFSINLVKARQKVSEELERILGLFRDFNGGMISQESQILAQLRQLLQGCSKYSGLLLENFFNSLYPASRRSTFDAVYLKHLFLLLLDTHKQATSLSLHHSHAFFRQEEGATHAVIYNVDSLSCNRIMHYLQNSCKWGQWNISYLTIHNILYCSCLLQSELPAEQQLFCSTIREALVPKEFS